MTYAELQLYWMVKCECYLQEEAGMSWDEAVDFLAEVVYAHSNGHADSDERTFVWHPARDYSPIAEALYEACCEASGVFCPDNLSNPYEYLIELHQY